MTRALPGFVVAALLQQAPQPPPSFRAGVELVQVDVVVVDDQGRPVRGLTQSDFTLLDRGRPQPIAAFEEVAHAFAASTPETMPASFPRDVADNSTDQSERLIVLALDDLVPNDRLDDIKRLARRVVEALGRGASLALVSSSSERQVEVTDNHAAILEQIGRISERTSRAPRVARTTSVETARLCQFHMFERAARIMAAEDQRRKAILYISPFCAGDLGDALKAAEVGGQETQFGAVRMIEALRRAIVDARGEQVKAIRGSRIDATLGFDEVPAGAYRLVVRAWDGTRTATGETGIVVR